MGFLANSRVILIQGLPLSYCMALENIPGRTRMDVFPSQSAGSNREEEVTERRLFAHYKKAEAESEGLFQKTGRIWLLSSQGIIEVKGKGISDMI